MGANPTLSPSPLWGGKTAKRSGWGAKGTSHSANADPTRSSLRSDHPPHEGEGEMRAVLPSHPNWPGFFQGIQRPRRLRRRELALIEDGRRLSPGSVAREGRKALRACCGGSGWSGSSGSVCQGPLPREPSETGVAWAVSRSACHPGLDPGRASSGSPPIRASAEDRRRSGDRLSQARRPSRRRRQ